MPGTTFNYSKTTSNCFGTKQAHGNMAACETVPIIIQQIRGNRNLSRLCRLSTCSTERWNFCQSPQARTLGSTIYRSLGWHQAMLKMYRVHLMASNKVLKSFFLFFPFCLFSVVSQLLVSAHTSLLLSGARTWRAHLVDFYLPSIEELTSLCRMCQSDALLQILSKVDIISGCWLSTKFGLFVFTGKNGCIGFIRPKKI